VPFPRRLLNDHEDVILDIHPHWWMLVPPVAVLAVTIGLSLWITTRYENEWASAVSLAPALAALVWFLVRYAKWATTNFVLTTDRLIYRRGVLAKHGREIPLERVNDITFNQSVVERMLGAGDLLIESGGERGQQSFSNISRPAAVQNEIYRQIEAAKEREAYRRAGFRELSLPEQLEKLEELRQRGVISQSEFDTKKSQLLERM
jgi:uncharacterized membrane protein YdbT with pleckstrin-like domain